MKRLAKIFGYLGVALLMLLALAFLGVQTPFFKDWLRGQIEEQVSDRLGIDLRIGKLQGNLVGGVVFSDVAVTRADGPLLSVQRLVLRYNVAALWRHTVHLHEVRLVGPALVVDPQAFKEIGSGGDSKVSGTDSSAMNQDDSAASLPWRIIVSDLALEQGRLQIEVSPRPAYLPEAIDPMNFAGSLYMHGDTLRVHADQFELRTHRPGLRLHSSPFDVDLPPEKVALTEVRIETGSSRLSLQGEVRGFKDPAGKASLRVRPLNFADAAAFLPEIPLHGTVEGDLEVVGSRGDLYLRTDLKSTSGRLHLEGGLALHAPYGYRLAGRLDRLDVGGLLARPEWTSDLTLRFELRGRGTEFPGSTADLKLRLAKSSFADHQIQAGRLLATLRPDSVSIRSDLTSSVGAVELTGNLSQLSKRPTVEAELNFRNVDAGAILGVDTLAANLQGRLTASGRIEPDTVFVGRLFVDLSGSRWGKEVFDDFLVQGSLSRGAAEVDTTVVRIQDDLFSGSGRLSFVDNSDFAFSLALPELQPVRRFLWSPEIDARVLASGRLTGRLDTARVVGQFDIEDYDDKTVAIRALTGSYLAARHDSVFFSEVEAEAAGLMLGGYPLDALHAAVKIRPDSLDVSATASGFGLDRLLLSGTLVPRDTSLFILRDLQADLNGQHWGTADRGAEVRFWEGAAHLRNVELVSRDQRIRLEGMLSLDESENFDLAVANLDLDPIVQAVSGIEGVSGRMDGKLRLWGTSERPELDGFLLFRDGGVAEFIVDSLYTAVHYGDQQLSWQLRVVRDPTQVLTGYGVLPIDLSMEESGSRVLDRPMEIHLNTGGMDLSFLEPFFERIEDLEGRFAAHIVLENTPFNPRGRGPITVYDGAFTVPEYGIRLREIAIRAQLEGTKATISQFKAESGPGRIEGTGALSLSREGLNQFALDLVASNFEIIHNEMMRARANGKLRLTGSLQEPRIEGDLTLVDGTLFLEGLEEEPVLMATNARGTSPLFSLGVDTLIIRKEEIAAAVEEGEAAEVRRAIGPRFDPYERLRGRIRVRIPRNTWVRSSAANFEIQGTIEMVKEGPEFVFFGPVEIVRGTYEIAGNRFQITEGRIVFQGEEDYNSQVHLVAEHRFTTLTDGERLVQKLRLEIEGTVYQPKLSFYYEDQEIEEKDFLAYLFFGQPFDALLSGEKSQLSGAALSAKATSLFGGLLAQHLGKTLGEAFRLDIVDIRREGTELEQTTVSVGKYIGPNLFLSLSQDFAGGQRLAIEYELFRRFFVQMVREQLSRQEDRTAFDVIWKIDW